MDEEAIIRLVQEGEKSSFEQLLEIHVRRLRAFVALNSPVSHFIDEITHETFVFAYENIRQFRIGGSFHGWLRAIAKNLIRAEIQRYSREQANRMKYTQRCLLEVAGQEMADNNSSKLDYLERCLQRIPERLRELVGMKYRFGYSTTEISGRLKRSAAWVRTTLFRVREELKHCIEAHLVEENA